MRVRRLPRATPIYAVGHGCVVERIRTRAAEAGPFALAGNAYGGVGIPDCIASGEAAAGAVLRALARTPAAGRREASGDGDRSGRPWPIAAEPRQPPAARA